MAVDEMNDEQRLVYEALDVIESHLCGPALYIARVKITALREQDINAQVMQPREFERLVENIRERGALESLPYCTSQDGGPIEIVSGHHRVRASRDAGHTEIWVILDLAPMTRSQIRAKQIAHNALVGTSDESILRRMIEDVKSVDDLLATGLPDDFLPLPSSMPNPIMSTPQASFDWHVVSITFLPHQMDTFRDLITQLDGHKELVGVAPVECFDSFASHLAQFARFREIRSVGTTIAVLSRIAADQVEMNDDPDVEKWVKVESVLMGDEMPAPAGKVVAEAIAKRVKREGWEPAHLWRVLEAWAAEELAR